MSWIRELWWWDAGWMGSIQKGAPTGLEPLYSIRSCRACRLTKSYSAAALCTQINSSNALAQPQMMSPFPPSHPCISALDLFTIETWNLIKFWIKSVMSCWLYLTECITRFLTPLPPVTDHYKGTLVHLKTEMKNVHFKEALGWFLHTEDQFSSRVKYYSDCESSCMTSSVALKELPPWWCHQGYLSLSLTSTISKWKACITIHMASERYGYF